MEERTAEQILEMQIKKTQKVVKGFKVRYMWAFLERFVTPASFMIFKTVFIKRSLDPRALQGLVAHCADHAMMHNIYGSIVFFFKYVQSDIFRAGVEVRGYALSILVAEKNGVPYDYALETCAVKLCALYRLGMDYESAHEVLDDTCRLIKERQFKSLQKIFDCFRRPHEGWSL